MIPIDQLWNYYYFYSPMRMGILAWYSFSGLERVLEINPQRGAITKLLLNNCASVTCRMYSEEQKEYFATTFKGDNIILENSDAYDGEVKYDIIFALHPFQDLCSENEIESIIQHWKSKLTDNGKLLLVVDNQYSINRIIGIKNLNNPGFNIKSFGNRLRDVFGEIKKYSVFPDSNFPQMIYSEDAKIGKELVDRLTLYARNVYELKNDGQKIYRDAIDDNLIGMMAPSVIFECSSNHCFSDIKKAYLNCDRGKYASVTCVYENKIVEKRPLVSNIQHLINLQLNHNALKDRGIRVLSSEIVNNSIRMKFVRWPILASVLKECVQNNVDRFVKILDEYYELIIKSSDLGDHVESNILLESGHDDWGYILKKAYWELSPINIFYDNGELVVFDQEYVFDNLPAKYILFRGLAHLYYFDEVFEKYYPLRNLKQRYHLDNEWDIYERLEQSIMKHVRGGSENNAFQFNLNAKAYWLYDEDKTKIESFGQLQDFITYFANTGNKRIVLCGTDECYADFMKHYASYVAIGMIVDDVNVGVNCNGFIVQEIETIDINNDVVIITKNDYSAVEQKLVRQGVRNIKRYVMRSSSFDMFASVE